MSLLQDDDPKVASLAMEQFLKLGDVGAAVAEFQEDGNSKVRHRIHQISSIIIRRQARDQFIQAVRNGTCTLWEGVSRINVLYDPQSSIQKTDAMVRELARELPATGSTAETIAELMTEKEFTMPDEDMLDGELYMMDSVLETKYGSAAALCVLARQVGELRDWKAVPVLFEGRLCLLQSPGILLDPAHKWRLHALEESDKLHTCAKRDVWYMFLTQLFLIALVDGQLRDLHHFGDLLTALNDGNVGQLPYPLGGGGEEAAG